MAQNKLSWRESRQTIDPGSPQTIYFNDTTPNHILISNNSAVPLFVGIGTIASPSSYDMIVSGYGTRMYPRMDGVNRIYVYTDSTEPITINVTSWEGDFDPASVPQSQEMVAGGADGLLGVIDINNFMNPLPPGDNEIGTVNIGKFSSPLPVGSNEIGRVGIVGELPAGTKEIGKVAITGELPAGTNEIGKVIIANPQDIGGGGGGASHDYSENLLDMYTQMQDTFNKLQDMHSTLYDINYSLSGGGGDSKRVETLQNFLIGGTIGVEEQNIYSCNTTEHGKLTLAVYSNSEKAAKISLLFRLPSFDDGMEWNYEHSFTYEFDKPEGVLNIYLTEKDIPFLGTASYGFGLTVKSSVELDDGISSITLLGVKF